MKIVDSLQIDYSIIEKRDFHNLKDKYTSKDFVYERNTEQSGLWTRFKVWFRDFIQDLFGLTSKSQASDITDIALKTFYIIIFLLVVYFIFKAIINKEGRWVLGKSSEKNIIPITDIEKNIHSIDFKSRITEAEHQDNYRLAIRYYYLWLLKELAKSGYIDYDSEKTDSDYLYEIKEQDFRTQFSYASYLYNYIWYGEFEVDNIEFKKAKTTFLTFINEIET